MNKDVLTPDKFLGDNALAKQLFAAIYQELEALGSVTIHTTRSQIAFRRQRNFAWVWLPGQYLKGKTAPLVLTLSLPRRDESPRWKEIVEPRPGRFTHHLELYDLTDVDEEVNGWLRQAWETAG